MDPQQVPLLEANLQGTILTTPPFLAREEGEARIGVVANRVRENTIIFSELYEFLRKMKVPYVATLRDTQNYIKAEERGLGIFELAPSLVWQDIENWEPLVKWLNSKRSMP